MRCSATGLDGALSKVSQSSYGPWLLGVVAAGLIGFALYFMADARTARSEDGSMTLGGRRVAVRRPRMRTADDAHELAVDSYEYFADREPSRLRLRVFIAGAEAAGSPQLPAPPTLKA